MLRWANLAIRVIAIILVVAVLLLTAHRVGLAEIAVEITALTVAILVLTIWVPADRLALGRRSPAVRPYALAAMMVVCSLAAATPTGGAFSLLILIAATAAGSDLALAAGITVVGLGIATTISAGLPLGASATVTVGYSLGLAFMFVLGRNLWAHRDSAAQADRLRQEQAKAATLDERARIAREIHDILAHSLGALSVQIQVARAVLTDQHDQSHAVEVLEQAQRMAAEGLGETRRAILVLRGERLPLPAGLSELSADHQQRHGTPVAFDVNGQPRGLSPDAQLAITRIAQEALVNTAKHAPHQPVRVRLEYACAETTLTVRNSLRRKDETTSGSRLVTVDGGHGLPGMRERLLLLGGTLSAGPESDDWLVVARVPQ